MKRASCKQLKDWAAEEKKSSKEYASYGFKGPAKDEAHHAKFFEGLIKKCSNGKSKKMKGGIY